MTSRGDQQRLITRAVVTLIAALLLCWVLYQLRGVLLVLYVSMLLAVGFSPLVRGIERWQQFRIPRWAAILVVYVGGIAMIGIVLSFVLPPLITQVQQLWEDLPRLVDQIQRRLVATGLIEQRWTWSTLLKNLQSPGLAVAGIFSILSTFVGLISTVITVLLLPYYLLVEAESLQKAFLHLFAPERRERVARISREVTVKVGAWLGGQLLLAGVIGTTASIGLFILGVPYFYVLGLIAAVGEMIPVVGPLLAAVPAILMGWTVSFKTAVFVGVYFAIQQFIENNVLVPRIMEKQVGVSAATIIVALLVGTELLGILGAVLAVPTAAIVQVLLQEHFGREES